MKHVNGDMEDLFRRASEKYPLRTDSADWDRLSAALDKDPGPPSNADKDEKRRRRGIFWWWLLLPLAVGAGIYSWHAMGRPSAQLSKVGTQAATQGTVAQGAGVQPGAQVETQEVGGAQTATQGAERQGAAVQQGTQVATQEVAGGEAGAPARGEAGSAGGTGSATGGEAGTPARGTGLAGRRGSATIGGTGLTDRVRSAESTEGGEDGLTVERMRPAGSVAETGGIGGGSAAGEAAPARPDWRRAQTAGSFSLVVDVKAPAVRKDSPAKQAKKATTKSNGGHGYIGLTGAPDFSTVKMQAMKGVGTTWGLLLGYAFNSHWAVESGIYLDRKKYYSAGEYFDKADAPAYGTLQSVNGICNMWEVPLNVRYNFNPGSKITWFATTGFSTYLMTKQKYSYELESSGASWNQDWSTTVHSNYLFSIINLSGGFEQRIGKIGNLRVEPYVRLPLSGIGTGRLPIMSAGLNIGITHRLW